MIHVQRFAALEPVGVGLQRGMEPPLCALTPLLVHVAKDLPTPARLCAGEGVVDLLPPLGGLAGIRDAPMPPARLALPLVLSERATLPAHVAREVPHPPLGPLVLRAVHPLRHHVPSSC